MQKKSAGNYIVLFNISLCICMWMWKSGEIPGTERETTLQNRKGSL